MNIKVTGRNIEITDSIREYVEKRAEKLEKFEGKNTEINAVCSVEREEQIVEIQVKHDGDFIRIEERNQDLYASIDLALDKVERQMRKEKEKRSAKNGRNTSFKEKFLNVFNHAEAENSGEVTKTMCYEIKPITVEDAKLKLEENGDMFLAFVNAENNEVNVIYQRGDGTFGIVIPE